jgi:hypothetical protein
VSDQFHAVKDPQAVLDYTVDWTDWLVTGDTITSHTVTVPAGITEDSSTDTDTAVTAWISGGTAGTRYDVVYHITTTAGRQDDRTITLTVQNR